MKNNKTKPKFDELDHFNFDFLEILEERNPTIQYKRIKDEMMADCCDIEIIKSDIKDDKMLFKYLVNYTSKYSFFIYNFEIR